MKKVRYPKVGEVWFHENEDEIGFGVKFNDKVGDYFTYYYYGKHSTWEGVFARGELFVVLGTRGDWVNEYRAGRLTFIGVL